jgi:di/tricarboxylate transporter
MNQVTGAIRGPASERARRPALLLLGAVAVLAAICLLPSPAPLVRGGNLVPLTLEGRMCLGIMAFAVTLWVTETVPFAVTSLLVVLLIPALGVADFAAWCAPASAIPSSRSSSAC